MHDHDTIAVDRATAGSGSKRATGPGLRMHARAGDFFFLDPRIHGSLKIRTDPRRIRIDPGFGGFVLPLVSNASKRRHMAWCCVCMQVNETGHAQRLNMLKQRPMKWFFVKKLTFFHRWRS